MNGGAGGGCTLTQLSSNLYGRSVLRMRDRQPGGLLAHCRSMVVAGPDLQQQVRSGGYLPWLGRNGVNQESSIPEVIIWFCRDHVMEGSVDEAHLAGLRAKKLGNGGLGREPEFVSVEGYDPLSASTPCEMGQPGHFLRLVVRRRAVAHHMETAAVGREPLENLVSTVHRTMVGDDDVIQPL